MESPRLAAVRELYARFNEADIDGVVELLAPDVEMPDVLHGRTLRGVEEARAFWEREFQLVEPSITVREVVEVGNAVLAVVYQETYDRNGGQSLGPGVAAVHRLTFRRDRVAAIEYTGLDDVPEQLRQRLG